MLINSASTAEIGRVLVVLSLFRCTCAEEGLMAAVLW